MAPSSLGPPVAPLAGLAKGSRVWWRKDPATWIPADLLALPAAPAAGSNKPATVSIQPLSADASFIAALRPNAGGGGSKGGPASLAPVGRPVDAAVDALVPANPALQDGIPDVVQLSHLTEPGILYNLGYRWGHT